MINVINVKDLGNYKDVIMGGCLIYNIPRKEMNEENKFSSSNIYTVNAENHIFIGLNPNWKIQAYENIPLIKIPELGIIIETDGNVWDISNEKVFQYLDHNNSDIWEVMYDNSINLLEYFNGKQPVKYDTILPQIKEKLRDDLPGVGICPMTGKLHEIE